MNAFDFVFDCESSIYFTCFKSPYLHARRSCSTLDLRMLVHCWDVSLVQLLLDLFDWSLNLALSFKIVQVTSNDFSSLPLSFDESTFISLKSFFWLRELSQDLFSVILKKLWVAIGSLLVSHCKELLDSVSVSSKLHVVTKGFLAIYRNLLIHWSFLLVWARISLKSYFDATHYDVLMLLPTVTLNWFWLQVDLSVLICGDFI